MFKRKPDIKKVQTTIFFEASLKERSCKKVEKKIEMLQLRLKQPGLQQGDKLQVLNQIYDLKEELKITTAQLARLNGIQSALNKQAELSSLHSFSKDVNSISTHLDKTISMSTFAELEKNVSKSKDKVELIQEQINEIFSTDQLDDEKQQTIQIELDKINDFESLQIEEERQDDPKQQSQQRPSSLEEYRRLKEQETELEFQNYVKQHQKQQ